MGWTLTVDIVALLSCAAAAIFLALTARLTKAPAIYAFAAGFGWSFLLRGTFLFEWNVAAEYSKQMAAPAFALYGFGAAALYYSLRRFYRD